MANFSMLTQEKIKKIHEKSLFILEDIGMKFHGERALKLMKDAGIKFEEGNIAKISSKHVEKALENVPKALKLYNRDGSHMITFDEKRKHYFGTHTDQLEFVDPVSGKVRPFLRSDIKTMCKVASALPNFSFALSVGMAADSDPVVQTQTTFIETIRNFDKTINFSSNDVGSLSDCINIASEFAGGLKNLQDKPYIFYLCDPIPPLTHPIESTEKIMIVAENRIPFIYLPYSMMGATSPMSVAGTLAQCNAEVLGGLVLAQLVSPGTPFIYGAMPSVMDMNTTTGSYGSPDFHSNIAAMAEIAAYYGLPFYGTAGCSDAKTLDIQGAAEVSYQLLAAMLSKATLIHDIGIMDHCNNVCPEVVVLADELIEGFKNFTSAIDVEEEDFAIDVIKEVGYGGHYLEVDHTLENFRNIWYPQIFSRKMQNPDESEISPEIKRRIMDIMESKEWDQSAKLDKDRLDILANWEKKLKI